jgi:hypothetical protein
MVGDLKAYHLKPSVAREVLGILRKNDKVRKPKELAVDASAGVAVQTLAVALLLFEETSLR